MLAWQVVTAIIGSAVAYWMLRGLRTAISSREWPSTVGVIVRAWVEERWKPAFGSSSHPVLRYRYMAGDTSDRRSTGQMYEATRAGEGWPGKLVMVHYDPRDPERSTLKPGVWGGHVAGCVLRLATLGIAAWAIGQSPLVPLASIGVGTTANVLVWRRYRRQLAPAHDAAAAQDVHPEIEALARAKGRGLDRRPITWEHPHGEPHWVDVPAGEFWMGDERCSEAELVHRVHVEQFRIAATPITNEQYALFVQATGHSAPGCGQDGRARSILARHPVTDVTWYDALAYCEWLSQVTGQRITLPSEAQWEKAARGDRDCRQYPWGDAWHPARCNTQELAVGGPSPVGAFPAGSSPYGCLDMAGNVWEWTRSHYGPYPYDRADGREKPDGEGQCVVRGGAYSENRDSARCACRLRAGSDDRYLNLGFRVVTLPSAQSA